MKTKSAVVMSVTGAALSASAWASPAGAFAGQATPEQVSSVRPFVHGAACAERSATGDAGSASRVALRVPTSPPPISPAPGTSATALPAGPVQAKPGRPKPTPLAQPTHPAGGTSVPVDVAVTAHHRERSQSVDYRVSVSAPDRRPAELLLVGRLCGPEHGYTGTPTATAGSATARPGEVRWKVSLTSDRPSAVLRYSIMTSADDEQVLLNSVTVVGAPSTCAPTCVARTRFTAAPHEADEHDGGHRRSVHASAPVTGPLSMAPPAGPAPMPPANVQPVVDAPVILPSLTPPAEVVMFTDRAPIMPSPSRSAEDETVALRPVAATARATSDQGGPWRMPITVTGIAALVFCSVAAIRLAGRTRSKRQA
jgi:hypothetical protein